MILTGLSMGGRGSWDLAAKYPERFAAVAPICGPGNPADAEKLKALPVWSFCGDADRDRTVLNMRQMVEALRQLGGNREDHRVPRRRPPELGPRVQRPGGDRLDARTEKRLTGAC